jgi:hypothetical protein
MVLPRCLKTFVTSSSPGKLVRGKVTAYRAVDSNGAVCGRPLRGVTKLLSAKLYSRGQLPEESISSTEFRGGAGGGKGGGIKRGRAVDSQVSRLAASSQASRNRSSKYKLTRMAFSALEAAGIEPVCGQRVVLDLDRRIATAADVIGYRKQTNTLVVVELKCGFSGTRTLPATNGRNASQNLSSPCSSAADCVLNRHLSQLAVTRHLFVKEHAFVSHIKQKFGIVGIDGCLLYACDRDTSLYSLGDWWVRRGERLIRTISE